MRFNFTVEEMQLEFLKVSLELCLELLWPKMTHDRRLVCFSNEVGTCMDLKSAIFVKVTPLCVHVIPRLRMTQQRIVI